MTRQCAGSSSRGKVAKHVLWKAEKKWKAKGWEIMFGGEGCDGYRYSGMMWADNC